MQVPVASNSSSVPSTADPGLGAGQIIAIVIGSLLALAGIGSLLGAGVLGWANATQRDLQGYFSTSTQRFATSTYAITSDRIDLNSGAGPGDWFVKNDNIATVRIRAKAEKSVFMGSARRQTLIVTSMAWPTTKSPRSTTGPSPPCTVALPDPQRQ